MTTTPTRQAIALNRFALGARAGEAPPERPAAWLRDQLDRYDPNPPAWRSQDDSGKLLADYADYRREQRGPNEPEARQQFARLSQQQYRGGVGARVEAALDTPAPFAERLVHFWANHFAVSVEKAPLALLAGSFEREAIRPHVMGRFVDMLLAVERHPGMLLYLDQARSTGPRSLAATRADPQRRRGLNENLAREILELHTLGVRSGYDQQDVQEFARALTGWSVAGLPGLPARGVAPGAFAFLPQLHEPGTRTVLGRPYEQRGEAQAEAILRDLAAHPATARHVARKLAGHFAGSAPELEQRLAHAYLAGGGDLPTLYRVLVDAPECWTAQPRFRTPWDWTLSTLRALDIHPQPPAAAAMATQLGQPVWRPGSPAGYADASDDWVAPDLLLRRAEMAARLAERAGPFVDARRLAPRLLPGGVGEATATAIARADTPATALALLLVSPEFLRR